MFSNDIQEWSKEKDTIDIMFAGNIDIAHSDDSVIRVAKKLQNINN